jgi:hypothetical protein
MITAQGRNDGKIKLLNLMTLASRLLGTPEELILLNKLKCFY